ncbi:PTS glucitol/sorbitol transporter subunit IIA [Halalkalibacterium halodurans]|uniref:PTS glucitol/sorbitol transporter subunit IIA n=1 Tax=Halalkalibacterium halodurans TaxID=86665 RepID=UPI002AA9F9DE|nr:PTS glucitol/sorbitol transporter subunit IIA [Halalkalibacterium halodurans]MDY7221275.1 PTS glucitol/sorbitol transporter subunit IIA [Halalkalibacterium halodurans]MDY7240514.1 PTS glucitol/sorbitol transporter subunit IIA [Halalkalibacterium halodurans]
MEGTMTCIYESVITGVGSEVQYFIEENMVVIFNDTVPDDLKSIGVIHKQTELQADVAVGDVLEVNGACFRILFVGDKVNDTLREIGHCTIAFNGETNAELPGTLCVEQKPLPDFVTGATIKFIKE